MPPRHLRSAATVGCVLCATMLSRCALASEAGKPFVQRIPGTSVSFEMMPIPAGMFRMGSPADEAGRKADEGPQVEVEVEAFHMGRCEVTWPEYDAFLHQYHRVASEPWDRRRTVPADRFADAVTYPTPMYELEMGPLLQRMGGRGEGFPAISASHYAASQYCKWLSRKTGRFYRLPTEAEWEYACRAGTTTAYSFGDDPKALDAHGWHWDNCEYENGERGYRRAGSGKPNAWGLYDMHGNVAEWCLDQYAADRYAGFAGGRVRASEAINWPKTRYPRVIRGGGWESEAQNCRSAARFGSDKTLNRYEPCFPRSPHWESSAFWVGFRVVSPAAEPTEAEKLRYWDVDDPVTRETLKRDRELREIVTPPTGG